MQGNLILDRKDGCPEKPLKCPLILSLAVRVRVCFNKALNVLFNYHHTVIK